MLTEPPTPPTRTSEALRKNVQSLNTHLDTLKVQWEDEKRQLLGEKAVLQDAANRLTAEVKDARAEVRRVAENEKAGERSRAGVQGVRCVL